MILNFYTFFAFLLTLGVIFVNGWTDAPNAITGCVCSGALSMKKAVAYAAVFNFLGIVISVRFFPFVAKNIFLQSNISGGPMLIASLLSVIILAVSAWFFGIPTSESHAIIASIIGASVATSKSFNCKLVYFTLVGLVVSVIGGFVLGYLFYFLLKDKQISTKKINALQILSALVMAFMHGAQDGQKFISIFLLASGMSSFDINYKVVLLCAVVMALGTATGGGRIIEKVGKTMVSINGKKSVASDVAGGISLFLSSVMGLPVSTTHAKTSAVMGCGYVTNDINKKTMRQMIAAWLITFPACFVMGYLFTLLFS